MAIEPLETEWGRKRRINQSSCNKDFSCVEGFCPSFVTVHGGQLRKPAAAPARELPPIPEPALPGLRERYSVLVAGIGGSGIVTVSQTLRSRPISTGSTAPISTSPGSARNTAP